MEIGLSDFRDLPFLHVTSTSTSYLGMTLHRLGGSGPRCRTSLDLFLEVARTTRWVLVHPLAIVHLHHRCCLAFSLAGGGVLVSFLGMCSGCDLGVVFEYWSWDQKGCPQNFKLQRLMIKDEKLLSIEGPIRAFQFQFHLKSNILAFEISKF